MKENKVIIITMVLNFIVAIIKLTSGIIFSFSTLIADSVQSFIDFVTDITSLIANKIGKRRANKTYPFGYGQVYYLTNMITGLLLFLIGIFILYQFFFFKGDLKPNIKLYVILIIVLILKLIVVSILRHYGKKYKSELIVEASKESKADFISTCVVFAISIIILFEEYIPEFINVDKLGSLGMAIYVFYTAMKMIIENIRGMLTNTEENDEIKEEVIEELNKFKELDLEKIKIVKMSAYYSVFLKIKVNRNMTIKKYLSLEKQVKTHLRSKDRSIRFIDIEPT